MDLTDESGKNGVGVHHDAFLMSKQMTLTQNDDDDNDNDTADEFTKE